MPLVVLDKEAVQALADPTHRKHRRMLAIVEATTGRRRSRPDALELTIPTAVQAEAGWDRRAPSTAALNRLRAVRPPLDASAADRAASFVAALGVSVADAHIAAVLLARTDGPHTVVTSDPDDPQRIIDHLGTPARIVTI